MAHPLVVHCKRSPFDVYVGRPTKWGNPFPLKDEAHREDCLVQYQVYLFNHPTLVDDAKRELKGKVLGCWCAPRLCHADILAEVANGY